MEPWQIELLKIGAASVAAFAGGVWVHWLKSRERRARRQDELRRREAEGKPELERVARAGKVTALFIQHRRHRITPEQFEAFEARVLGRRLAAEESQRATLTLVEPLRSLEEVTRAEEEMFEKVWWNRHQEFLASGRVTDADARRAADIERRHGRESLVLDEHGWGVLTGRLEALHWIGGGGWGLPSD